MNAASPLIRPQNRYADEELIDPWLRVRKEAMDAYRFSPVNQLVTAVQALLTELEQQRLASGEELPDWPAIAAVHAAMQEASAFSWHQHELIVQLRLMAADWPAMKQECKPLGPPPQKLS